MTARETVERHAQDVVDGNLPRIMGDFAGSAFSQLMASGGVPPRTTSAWSILSESTDSETVQFHVRYTSDNDALELQTTWKQFDSGAWKIIEAKKVAP
ncbi:MAG: hypothetical protein RL238_3064 [Actinomycetota bacterium]